MFRHFDLHRGQFKDLAFFVSARGHLRQRRLTLVTGGDPVHTEVLRLFDHLQSVSRMAGLAAGSLSTRGPQIVRPGLLSPSLDGGLLLLPLCLVS